MLIGIDFGDNDFSWTVKTFLKMFTDSMLVVCYPEQVTKQNILQLWKMLAPGCYLIGQSGFGYDSDLQALSKYFNIEEDRIYLNEECLANFLEDNNWSFHYIDTETGAIYSS